MAMPFFFFFLKCNLLPLEVSEVCGIVPKRRTNFFLFYTFPALVPLCFSIPLVNTVGYICLDRWNWCKASHSPTGRDVLSCLLLEPGVNYACLKHWLSLENVFISPRRWRWLFPWVCQSVVSKPQMFNFLFRVSLDVFTDHSIDSDGLVTCGISC